MVVSVVPDSGCDQLVGLAGTMTIKIGKGPHYDPEYAVAETPRDAGCFVEPRNAGGEK